MWFLKGRPTSIDITALLQSIQNGYQQNSLRFKVAVEPERTVDGKVWISFPMPWSPQKERGGFTLSDGQLLTKLEGCAEEDITVLTDDDIKVYEKPRALKRESTIDLVYVQDLYNCFPDDFGVVAVWVEPEKWYELNYKHKIAADSQLYAPIRLPTVLTSRPPTMKVKIWYTNGTLYEAAKGVKRVDVASRNTLVDTSLGCVELDNNDYSWDQALQISTTNWESSDDDWESEED